MASKITAAFAGIKNLLGTQTHITAGVFKEIVNGCPPGIVARLRLVPDQLLAAKLAHLHAVLSFLDNGPALGFDYTVVSIEGISDGSYLFDHDVIVNDKISGKTYVIDCTSNPRLLASKLEKLYAIIAENAVNATPIVHVFNPRFFSIQIEKPSVFTDSNAAVFNLFDSLSVTSQEVRNRFYSCCGSVYDEVLKNVLSSDREELSERYQAWEDDPEVVNLAIKLAKEHSIHDAENFRIIAKNTGAGLYYDTFGKILTQQRPIREPLLVGQSDINEHRQLIDVLAGLSNNLTARVLHAALGSVNGWCAIDVNDELLYNISFQAKTNKTGMLPANSCYKIVAKHNIQHTFMIFFSEEVIDQNMREQVFKQSKLKENTAMYDVDINTCYTSLCEDYSKMYRSFISPSQTSLKNTIFGKIETMSDIYQHDHDNVSGTAASIAYHAARRFNAIRIGALVNHQYEVAKTFAASLKVSAKKNMYYVGVNGPYASITIIRMASTQDSFTTASFFVIYKSVDHKHPIGVKPTFMNHEDIVQTKTRTLNKNSLAHYLKLPSALLSLVTWEIEHIQVDVSTLDGRLLNQIIVNSILHLSVNNDQFAQSAEQIRYLFTSNVGLGADPLAICSKIDFIRPATTWELLYIFRMLKLACSLNVAYKNKRIGDLVVNNEFAVMFPNSVVTGTSFSHLISSMYYANLYNKFRAFHEVSEAICYNGLTEEDDIYQLAVKSNIEQVNGIKQSSMKKIMDRSFLTDDSIIQDEVEFCKSLVDTGASRFKLSIMFIVGAAIRTVNTESVDYSVLYKHLSQSPIEACTMHGGMEKGASTVKPQGIRAASVMLEELIDEYGSDTSQINKNVLRAAIFIDDLENKDFDFSILSCALRQFIHVDDYRYRIVQKDQKGHREISVLNAKFRLGALFTEKLSHELSSLVLSDVLDDKNKDSVLETSVRKILRDNDVSLAVSDNSDQKRWGPNHLLHSFSAMYFSLLRHDMGLFRTVNLIFQYGENKRAKFPEKLIALLSKTGKGVASDPISEFIRINDTFLTREIYDRKFEWGMCQGIFHRTSSLYHGIMCNVVRNVLSQNKSIPPFELDSYVTSDDAERLFTFKGLIPDRVALCRTIHATIINVGSVMNILRNESKSVFSAHITEFNSIFYHKGFLATPTLKQRISKLDIGDGHDHINDYLTALSLPMGYLQNGGSYSGAVVLTILNLVMHTEQWRRWDIIEKRNHTRPVEFGGFPAIEPFSTMISGPIVNFFLRALPYCSVDSYSNFLAETSLTPAIEVNLADFSRTQFKAALHGDIFILKTSNPIGIVSVSRTDKRLSQFEKRHHMTQWLLRDSSITLNPSDASAKKFIFNLSKITKTCKFETTQGTNTFYKRFTDPWLNSDRKCLRYNSNSTYVSSFLKIYLPEMTSFNEYISKAVGATNFQMRDFFSECLVRGNAQGHNVVMANKIKNILNDAVTVRDTLGHNAEVRLQKVVNKNSIVRVNLSSGMTIDSEIFYHTLIKNIVGRKAEQALIERTRNANIWDNLENMGMTSKASAIEGIYLCDNIMLAHSKFIRTSTKLICPGELKPSTLPDLLDAYLSNKFTEKFGTTHKKFPQLTSSIFHSVAFKDCNRELISRSKQYLHEKELNVNVLRVHNVPRFGIVSDTTVITEYDTFKIEESCMEKKIVKLNVKGKNAFMQRGKMWAGARVFIALSNNALKLLLRSQLTHYHEYAINEFRFVKNQTCLVLEVIIDEIPCFEIQETLVTDEGTYYNHHYFVNTRNRYVTAIANVKQNDDSKYWAAKLGKFINDTKRFQTDEEYVIPPAHKNQKITDSVFFHKINDDDLFTIEDFPNNLTLFLKHVTSGVLIPICSTNDTEIVNMDLGFVYDYPKFEEALHAFRYFYHYMVYEDKVPDNVQEYLRMLLFRTSAHTPVSFLNTLASKKGLPIHLTSLEVADILRVFLMCNLIKDMKSNRSRMQHYFLNLFKSSPFYNNGITSVRFNEKLFTADKDGKTNEEEFSEDPVDTSIPDKPAWYDTDRSYDDLLTTTNSIFTDPELAPESSSFDILASICEGDIGSEDDDEYDDAPLEQPSVGLAQVMKSALDEATARLANPVIPTLIEPQVTAGVEIIDVAVISRMFEGCPLIIRNLKKMAQMIRIKKTRLPMFGDNSTFFGSIQMYTTKVVDNLSSAKFMFDRSFGEDATMFNIRIPLSAICLAELNY